MHEKELNRLSELQSKQKDKISELRSEIGKVNSKLRAHRQIEHLKRIEDLILTPK